MNSMGTIYNDIVDSGKATHILTSLAVLTLVIVARVGNGGAIIQIETFSGFPIYPLVLVVGALAVLLAIVSVLYLSLSIFVYKSEDSEQIETFGEWVAMQLLVLLVSVNMFAILWALGILEFYLSLL